MAALIKVLRIGTWNIHEAVPVGQDLQGADEIRKEIADLLIRYKLDIVGLQEVDFLASPRSLTLETIRDNTSLRHGAFSILSESAFHPVGQAGVAIVSRFPLKETKRRRFSNPELGGKLNGEPIRSFDKGFVSTRVSIGPKLISAVSVHAFPFHLFGRDAQDPAFSHVWSDLSDCLAQLTSTPLVVCGDFNTDKRDLIASENLSLTRAITHQPTYRNDTVDDVLFTQDFQLQGVEVVDNFSDHRLCYAELVWEKGEFGFRSA